MFAGAHILQADQGFVLLRDIATPGDRLEPENFTICQVQGVQSRLGNVVRSHPLLDAIARAPELTSASLRALPGMTQWRVRALEQGGVLGA